LRPSEFCPGLPGWAGTRKVKPIWIYWSKRQWHQLGHLAYANLHLAQTHDHASNSIPPTTKFFLHAGCPSCRSTNNIKALKAKICTRMLMLTFKKRQQHMHVYIFIRKSIFIFQKSCQLNTEQYRTNLVSTSVEILRLCFAIQTSTDLLTIIQATVIVSK